MPWSGISNQIQFEDAISGGDYLNIYGSLNLQVALPVLLKYTQNLTEIVIDINQLICDNAKVEKFISLFIAKYNISTRKLIYFNSGHNAPLLFNNYQTIPLDKGCTLLGIMRPLIALESETILAPLNSILFSYTDGLTETVNNKDETLTIDEMISSISENKQSSCEFINQSL